MKKIPFLLFVLSSIFACSSDDNSCDAKKLQITNEYQTQINYVLNHPNPDGIDYGQIDLLKQERDNKISNACK